MCKICDGTTGAEEGLDSCIYLLTETLPAGAKNHEIFSSLSRESRHSHHSYDLDVP